MSCGGNFNYKHMSASHGLEFIKGTGRIIHDEKRDVSKVFGPLFPSLLLWSLIYVLLFLSLNFFLSSIILRLVTYCAHRFSVYTKGYLPNHGIKTPI